MECQINWLAFCVNVHDRLSRDFPMTPYNSWVRWVHQNKKLSPQEKWERLLAWDICPDDYTDPRLFSYDWQLFKMLSKLSLEGKPTEKEVEVAYAKFTMAEKRCQLVNQQFIAGETFNQWHRDILAHAKKTISYVLGDINLFFEHMDNNRHGEVIETTENLLSHSFDRRYTSHACQFGPGVSVGYSSSLKTLSEKITQPTCTAGHLPYQSYWQEGWDFSPPTVVHGSTLFFVNKRVGEARTICYEPSMNMLTQKMVGQFMKNRMKYAIQIDLSDQTRNRRLAELGSLCDSYCTIDLSAASDLNSSHLMLELLPFEWFCFLDSIRSQSYFDSIRNSKASFEKFSTMGNGFTFELETLIFYAIAQAAIWKRTGELPPLREISVYGDDIIVPKQFYHDVCGSLTLIGHIPNESKSFPAGPFRESCGGDYFCGHDVTAVKIHEVKNEIDIVNLYNNLFGKARTVPGTRGVCPRYEGALSFIKRWLFEHYPKLSEGPIEYEPSASCYSNRLQPTNRWLFSDAMPREWRNVTWSKFHQRMLPKFVLLDLEVPTTVYDANPQLAKYISQYGGQLSGIYSRLIRYSRNPERGAPSRKRGKSTILKRTTEPCWISLSPGEAVRR